MKARSSRARPGIHPQNRSVRRSVASQGSWSRCWILGKASGDHRRRDTRPPAKLGLAACTLPDGLCLVTFAVQSLAGRQIGFDLRANPSCLGMKNSPDQTEPLRSVSREERRGPDIARSYPTTLRALRANGDRKSGSMYWALGRGWTSFARILGAPLPVCIGLEQWRCLDRRTGYSAKRHVPNLLSNRNQLLQLSKPIVSIGYADESRSAAEQDGCWPSIWVPHRRNGVFRFSVPCTR